MRNSYKETGQRASENMASLNYHRESDKDGHLGAFLFDKQGWTDSEEREGQVGTW